MPPLPLLPKPLPPNVCPSPPSLNHNHSVVFQKLDVPVALAHGQTRAPFRELKTALKLDEFATITPNQLVLFHKSLPKNIVDFIAQIGVNKSHMLLEAVAQKRLGTASSIISEMQHLDSLNQDENAVKDGTKGTDNKPPPKPKKSAPFKDGPPAFKCPIPGCMWNFKPTRDHGKHLWFPFEEKPLQHHDWSVEDCQDKCFRVFEYEDKLVQEGVITEFGREIPKYVFAIDKHGEETTQSFAGTCRNALGNFKQSVQNHWKQYHPDQPKIPMVMTREEKQELSKGSTK